MKNECPECGGEMVWQNDWDLEEGMIMSAYDCADQEYCETSVQIFRRIKD